MECLEPPKAEQGMAEVVLLEPLARDTYRIRLTSPTIARAIRPGQFVMLRPRAGHHRPLARPPLRPL